MACIDPENLFVTMALSSPEMKGNIKSTRVLSNKKDPIWNEDLYQLVTSGKGSETPSTSLALMTYTHDR